ncbi:DNA repair protein complementing XP-C cells homolog isoform X1 [Plutella xylostella]|uniref:DNA repair protein complementing XP-C cells homolog isoform X1 n=1 Tax=Plutella xylostella TaxID=51655 RepID=UPI002032DF09|nr:DNA repair protein complementing XP-C cells homolog isoform X1 [Plutella xylostella]
MNTRKKAIKTVYKEDDDSDADAGLDFSDSGSEAEISEPPSSDEADIPSDAHSSADEFATTNNKPAKAPQKKHRTEVSKARSVPAVRKTKFAKSFISKIRPNTASSDEDEGDNNKQTFSVKNLTEEDKLLPSILKLSDSESSDDDSPKASTSINNTASSSYLSQNYESDSDKEQVEYQDVWAKNLKESEEVAKKAFMELAQRESEMQVTKDSVEKYLKAKDVSMEVECDVKDLLAQGEEAAPATKKNKIKKKKADSDSEMEDWEEVNEAKAIPQQGIQLIVNFPDGCSRKSKKLDVEMMMKRKINRVKKENQVHMHKVHVLCWLGHGNYVSRVLNDQDILSAVLTLLPSEGCYPGPRIDMKYVEQITTWYKNKLTLKQDKHEDKYRPKAPPLKEMLLAHVKNKTVTAKKYLVFIFVSLLRALGLQCRVMFNFVTLPLKPPESELCSLATKPKDKADTTTKDKKTPVKKEKTTKSTKSKKAIPQVDGNYDLSDSDFDSIDDEYENIMQIDGNDDTKVIRTRSGRSEKSKMDTAKENEDVSPPKRSKLDPATEIDKLKVPVKRNRSEKPASGKVPANSIKKDVKLSESIKLETNKTTANKKPSPQKTVNAKKDVKANETNKLEIKNTTENNKPSPRKTRSKAQPNHSKSTAKPLPKKPEIKITNENKEEVCSEYFESTTAKPIKKLSLSRNRSQTSTPQETKDTDKLKVDTTKAKSRTKSAPGTAVEKSKYFSSPDSKKPSREMSKKEKVLEDAQRVSHRDLQRKGKPVGDVKGDLIDIIKSRVQEAKVDAKKGIVKGKVKKESEGEDSDYLPEEAPKRRNSDSDGDFKPCKISPRPAVKKKIDRRVLSSEEPEQKNKIDVWCEVFVEELEQWVPVDVVRAKVHCAEELYKAATHPAAYIVGWDNNNYLKDLTRRYVPHFNTVTLKQRVSQDWWGEATRPWKGPKSARDRNEDSQLDRMQLEAPLPKTVSEYKNHPLYALKRHLLKFEAIYPPDAATLGFVRGEPVYARDCVFVCRSRDTWLKEAKVVRPKEQPYKIVKARPKWDKLSNRMISDIPLEVFGPWQVSDYEPPTAVGGVVPRNAYGNVELFKLCMLPKGTAHVRLPGLNKVAKKLNIDCAPAMTGFDYNGGYSHPVYDGYVVCKEFEEIITEAWLMDQEDQERRENEKMEARVYGNWKKLIKGLLIRERLKHKYGFEEPSTSTEVKKKAKGPKLVVKKRN